MRLYEKVARTLAKHTNGEWEKYEDLRSLESFCKGLEEMGNTQVLRHMVAVLDEDHAREYDPRHWHEVAEAERKRLYNERANKIVTEALVVSGMIPRDG